MSCTTEAEIDEEYATPDGMTDEERDLMQKEVNLARSKAMRAAQQAGRGPNTQEMLGHEAAIRARDAAHDRWHLDELKRRAEQPEGDAKALPAHVLAAKAQRG